MTSFREQVRSHVSVSSLFFLIAVGIVSLGYAGKALLLAEESTLDILGTESDVYMNLSDVHQAFARKQSVPPPSSEVPDRSFALGEKSKEVLLLQKFLVWKGYLPKNTELTAYFGPDTLDAVKKYQVAMHLKPEGVVGPQTREAWKKDVLK